jgi:hypothetical protein
MTDLSGIGGEIGPPTAMVPELTPGSGSFAQLTYLRWCRDPLGLAEAGRREPADVFAR